MASVSAVPWEALERRGPTLFLVAGGLVLGHAAILGARAFTDLATPTDVFAPAGHFLALVGLLGLYPAIAAGRPAAARVAAVVATVSATGWFGITAWQVGTVVDVLPARIPALPPAVALLVIATTILAYALFGVAFARLDGRSRRIGVLMLAPAGLFVALIGSTVVTGTSAVGGFAVGAGLAFAHLAIGYSLRVETSPTTRAPPASDATA